MKKKPPAAKPQKDRPKPLAKVTPAKGPDVINNPAPRYRLVYGFTRMEALLKLRGPGAFQRFKLIGEAGIAEGSIQIELGNVIIDPSINLRLVSPTPEEVEAMIASIKAEGLLEDPGVQLSTGDVRLARRANLVENVRRKGLAPHELATGLHTLKKAGETMDTLQASSGLSPDYIYGLIRCREKLHPDLWEIFSRAGRSAPVNEFISLCQYPAEEQLARWQQKTAGGAQPPAGKGSPRPRAKSLLQKVPTVEGDREPRLESDEWRRGLRFGLAVIAGQVQWSP